MKKEKKFDQRKLQVTLEIFASSGFIVGSLNTGLLQKQRSRGALRKKCSENMQQIYRRTLILKSDFNKVALKLYRNHTPVWVFSCKFAANFQNIFFPRTPLEGCFCC